LFRGTEVQTSLYAYMHDQRKASVKV